MSVLLKDKKEFFRSSSDSFKLLKIKRLDNFISTFYSNISIMQMASQLHSAISTRTKYKPLYVSSNNFISKNKMSYENFKNQCLKLFEYDIKERLTLYSDLKNLRATCQYCYTSSVNALDHYIDKDNYPELSVFPDNLIPTCTNCNSKKNKKDVSFVYPYYSFLHNNDWINCEITLKSDNYTQDKFNFEMCVNMSIPSANYFEKQILVDLNQQFVVVGASEKSIQYNGTFFRLKINSIQKAKKNKLDKDFVKSLFVDTDIETFKKLPDHTKNLSQYAVLLGLQSNYDFIWNNI